MGQAYTHADPTWPQYLYVAAGGGGGGCSTPYLFLHIDTPLGSSGSIADGTFMAQKIKNVSDVDVTIKRLSWPIQTNNGAGPPVWTGYVRTSPDMGAGSTYGSASVTTNRSRTGTMFVDLNWAAGTEPVVPAGTDFYIGASVALNGASVSQPYDVVGGGVTYVDTTYALYENGALFGSVNTRDVGLDIFGCFDRPTCTSSNLWSSPISQSQTATDNDRNLAYSTDIYRQKIHNTSGSKVMIKKFRVGLQSTSIGDVDVRAVVNSSGNYQQGNQYGFFSQVVTIPNGMASQFVDILWDDGFEPIIPANTDFYIGIFPFANNRARINVRDSSTSYETSSWNYGQGGPAGDEGRDMQFEVYICQ